MNFGTDQSNGFGVHAPMQRADMTGEENTNTQNGNGLEAPNPLGNGMEERTLSKSQLMDVFIALQSFKQRQMTEDPRFKALVKIVKQQNLTAEEMKEIQAQMFRKLASKHQPHQHQQTPGQPQPPNPFLTQAVMAQSQGGSATKQENTGSTVDQKSLAASNHGFAQRKPKFLFTPTQLTQLKAQIIAFKQLSRNQPIPENLYPALGLKPGGSSLPATPLTKPMAAMANMTPTSLSLQDRSTPRTPKFTIENIPGLKPMYLAAEREKYVKTRLENRQKELSILPLDMPEELKLKAEIELTQLRLLEHQRQVRAAIAAELKRVIAIENAAERSTYRRSRKAPTKLSEAEKLSLDQKRRRKAKHKDFMNQVTENSKKFKEFHSQHLQKVKRVNRSVVTFHASKARREQQRREKAEKDRLRALKENDEVAYMQLLQQTKNNRLTELLQQTDDYLEQISAKVAQAKGESIVHEDANAQKKDLAAMSEEEKKMFFAKEAEDAKQLESTKAYYTLAHTIQEDIYEQPEMLVGGTLKPYQMVGLQWLVSLYNNNLNGVLADEMGLGKTIQSIALITYLMEKKGNNGPFLIVVPLSTLHNWEGELQDWAPSVVTVSYKGNKHARKAVFRDHLAHGKFNVLLTTYDFVLRDQSRLSSINWNYIIVDEGHRMKNVKCKLTISLSKHYKSRHRVLLTGTPLQNSLPELWSLLNFLLPTIFNSVDSFEQWFSAPFAIAGEEAEMTEEERLLIIHRLHKVLRPFLLRREKSEVEDQLPEKVEKILRCEKSALQHRLYETMKNKGLLMCDPNSQKVNSKGLKNTLMQLRKACNHPFLFYQDQYYMGEDPFMNSPDVLIRASGKFALLDNILPKLKETGHRVLLFSQMTSLLDVLEHFFSYRQFSYLRLDGSTKPEDRATMVTAFNEEPEKYFIFMLSTRAGGLGLNLQTADTVVIFDSDWNPQQDLQAQDRAHRIGQKKAVLVLRLITTNSIEEKILARANHKLDVDKMIIQAGKFNNSSTLSEQREFLKNILKQRTEGNDDEEVPTLEEINTLIARAQEEMDLFNKMDELKAAKQLQEWKERGNKGRPPPPLLLESELPQWMLVQESKEDQEEIEYGRGMRERSSVIYDDGLSDFKWQKMIEAGEDVMDADTIMKAKSKKGRKRKRDDEEEEDAAESEEEEDEDVDEVVDVKETTKSKAAGKKKRKIVQNPAQQQLNSILLSALEYLRTLTGDDGRFLTAIFEILPSKRDYPDYYNFIKQPIDLKTIEKNVLKSVYTSVEMFKSDILLIFSNARQYNLEDSFIYQDASKLQEECFQKLDVLAEEQQNAMNVDEEAEEEEATSEPKKQKKKRGRKSRSGTPNPRGKK